MTRDKISLALLEHLIRGPSDAEESYVAVANILGLPTDLRSLKEDSGRSWWEHQVRFAKQSCVDRGLVDNAKRNIWKINLTHPVS